MAQRKAEPAQSGRNSKNERSMSQGAALFHPWFLPRSAWLTIVQAIPREYLMKMRDYFDRYGCISCNRRDRTYGENGFCKLCFTRISRRLRRCLKRRFGTQRKVTRAPEWPELLKSERLARRLLRDLIPAKRAIARTQPRKYTPNNPTNNISRLAGQRHGGSPKG